MNNKAWLLAALLFLSSALAQAADERASASYIVDPKEVLANELARLDLLIEATEQSLKQQIKLRGRVKHYQELQNRYLANPDDNEVLFQLVKAAHAILESIKALHLETAFEPEFLSELSLVSKPAAKGGMGIPKP